MTNILRGLWLRLFGLRKGTRVTVLRGKHTRQSGTVAGIYGSWYMVRLSNGRGIRCYSREWLVLR
jgi:hypothetical protein